MQISKYSNKFKIKNSNGMSLIEILVVVAIFAILGIIVTRAIILTVGGSRKSESLIKVRENLDYASSVIERQIRNANSITNCAGQSSTPGTLNYVDQDGNPSSFSCVNVGGSSNGYVASGSAQLTNSAINVISCSFSCSVGTSANPDVVGYTIEANDSTAVGTQNSTVTISNTISLRNY